MKQLKVDGNDIIRCFVLPRGDTDYKGITFGLHHLVVISCKYARCTGSFDNIILNVFKPKKTYVPCENV